MQVIFAEGPVLLPYAIYRRTVRVLLLNQYFPPDRAPTGVLLAEVAEALRDAGHEVELLGAQQQYRAGQAASGRMRREISALWRILRAGLRVSRRPDVIISGTSPPLLLVAATLLSLRFRARSIHWAMDLYPDLAVALDEIPPGAMAALLEGVMGWCYRRTDLTVALDADMESRLTALGARTECLRPWVPRTMWELARDARATDAVADGAPWMWIYSGNLGRAHEWATLLEAQRILEASGEGIRLVFQGGGPGWPVAKARAEDMGLRGVEWRPYAEDGALVESLLACQAAIVTQKPEIAGMLWPSKLALLLTLPRPLIFIGPPEGAIASELRRLPHAGVFAPGDSDGVAAWVRRQQREGQPVPRKDVLDGGAHRAASLARWVKWVEQGK